MTSESIALYEVAIANKKSAMKTVAIHRFKTWKNSMYQVTVKRTPLKEMK